jgi:hypothetical protein
MKDNLYTYQSRLGEAIRDEAFQLPGRVHMVYKKFYARGMWSEMDDRLEPTEKHARAIEWHL